MLAPMPQNVVAAPPPVEVQRRFGCVGPAERYASGEGTTFRIADAVFKPVTNRLEAEWIGGVLQNLREDEVRVGRPIRATDGEFVIDGWTAWQWVGEARQRIAGTRS